MIIKIDEKEKYESYLLYFLAIREQTYKDRDSAINYFWQQYAASDNKKKEFIDEIKSYGIDDPMKALSYFDLERKYIAYHKLPKRRNLYVFLLLFLYLIVNIISVEIGQFFKTNSLEPAIQENTPKSDADVNNDIPWFFCKTDTIYTKYKLNCPTFLYNEYGRIIYGKFKYEQTIKIGKHANDACNKFIINDLINEYHAKNVIPKDIEIIENGITNGVYLSYLDTLPNGSLTENTDFSECIPINDSTYKSLLRQYKISNSLGYNSYISRDVFMNSGDYDIILMRNYKIIK